MKAYVSVGLQDAGEVTQVLAGMLALAIRRVGEPDSWRHILTSRTIIAHIRPESRGFGLAHAGREHRYRSVVGMNLGCTYYVNQQ